MAVLALRGKILIGYPFDRVYCGGSERNSYVSVLNYILDKVVFVGDNRRLLRANDFCTPIPISVLMFLLASIGMNKTVIIRR